MKQLPILFSTDMVRAILEGRKTMTRRIVKGGFDPNQYPIGKILTNDKTNEIQAFFFNPGDKDCRGIPPKYQIGDVLYVREAWNNTVHIGGDGKLLPPSYQFAFRADFKTIIKGHDKFKPSIHMPKSAARIWLEVTDIKVERVRDITQEDAMAEGLCPAPHKPSSTDCLKHADKSLTRDCYCCAFKLLWNQINGESGNSWAANPWVWVIEYKVLSTTGKPENIA